MVSSKNKTQQKHGVAHIGGKDGEGVQRDRRKPWSKDCLLEAGVRSCFTQMIVPKPHTPCVNKCPRNLKFSEEYYQKAYKCLYPSDFDLGRICCAQFDLKKQILWFSKILKSPVSIYLIQIQTWTTNIPALKVHHLKIKTLVTQTVLIIKKKAHNHISTKEPTILSMPCKQ